MKRIILPSPTIQLDYQIASDAGIELWCKRDDLIHPEISGNKWRKLKHNVEKAKKDGHTRILTFGGAYSNHIAAAASIASESELEWHAMIRGEELNSNSNLTLQLAAQNGLNLHFVDRKEYQRLKRIQEAAELDKEWEDCYLIPEGGCNEEGVLGCEEITAELDDEFDYIILAAGTGTTAAGILRTLESSRMLVFPALKGGEFLEKDILEWQPSEQKKDQLQLISDYHFGGYAKVNNELKDFCKYIENEIDLPLDYIYTAKAFYGMTDLIHSGFFKKGSRLLFYHSGGLQGNKGFA